MKQRNRNLSWLLWVSAFVVINFIIFVLVTATPKFDFSIQEQEDTNQVQVSILRTSFFPFSKIEVLLDDVPLELTKLSDKVYSAMVDSNGTLEIRTTNFNGMQKNTFERIGTIDDTPPNVYGEFTAIGEVTLKLEDVQSGIHYEAIYALANDSDETILPAEIDREKQQVVFRFPGGTLEVHIFDLLGNEAISTFDDSATSVSTETANTSSAASSTSQTRSSAASSTSQTRSSAASSTSQTRSSAASSTSQTRSSAASSTSQTRSSAASSTSQTRSSAASSTSQTRSSAAESTSQTRSSAVESSAAVTSTAAETTPRASAQNSQAPSASDTEQLIGPGAALTATTSMNDNAGN